MKDKTTDELIEEMGYLLIRLREDHTLEFEPRVFKTKLEEIAQTAKAEGAKELEITEKLLQHREMVLRTIPECPAHGYCVPHAIEWIEKQLTQTNIAEQAKAEGAREERERIEKLIMPKIQKFIDKVESGRARSKETYADMKEIKNYLTPPNE